MTRAPLSIAACTAGLQSSPAFRSAEASPRSPTRATGGTGGSGVSSMGSFNAPRRRAVALSRSGRRCIRRGSGPATYGSPSTRRVSGSPACAWRWRGRSRRSGPAGSRGAPSDLIAGWSAAAAGERRVEERDHRVGAFADDGRDAVLLETRPRMARILPLIANAGDTLPAQRHVLERHAVFLVADGRADDRSPRRARA